jgi:hypothetical protein
MFEGALVTHAVAGAPLAESVVPIIGETDKFGEPQVAVYGTGTLLRIGGRHLLLTAAHVIRDLEEDKVKLAIQWGIPEAAVLPGQRSDLIAVSGRAHSTSNTALDLGWIELDAQTIGGLDHRRFLGPEVISVRPRRPDERYLVIGYPQRDGWTRLQDGIIHTKPFHHEEATYAGPEPVLTSDSIPYDPKVHTRVRWEGHGDLGGISGCAVWTLDDARSGSLVWTPPPKLVIAAIETDVVERRWIRGTSTFVFLLALVEVYPDLRPTLEALWYPLRGGVAGYEKPFDPAK